LETARTISKIQKRREFVRALCYEQCPKNSFKRLYMLRGCWSWSEKLLFRKNFDENFHAVERVRSTSFAEKKLSRRDYLDYLKNKAKSGDMAVLEFTSEDVNGKTESCLQDANGKPES